MLLLTETFSRANRIDLLALTFLTLIPPSIFEVIKKQNRPDKMVHVFNLSTGEGVDVCESENSSVYMASSWPVGVERWLSS